MKRIVVFVALVSVTMMSCHLFHHRVKGSGHVVSITRDVNGFNSVDVSSAIDVYVRQDSAQSVKVVIDDNLQSYIHVRVENGTLIIEQENNTRLSPTAGIKVYVGAPSFHRFEASGACNYYSENRITTSEPVSINLTGASDGKLELSSPKITADLTGAGSLTLRGETRDLSLDATGSSTFKCMQMMAENVDVDLTGASDAEVFASVKLNISTSGASNVNYKGNASVNQKTSGASSVRKVE